MTTSTGDESVLEQPFEPFHLGRYHVVAPLGSGGMAQVYLAEQRGVGGFARRVVIKQIHEQHAANERFVKMFVDEANIAVNLTHPNVVQVLELQQEDKNLYMVLEFVDGLDLNTLFNALVDDGQRLPVDLALYVTNAVLAGLVHAHAAKGADGQPLNLIHRDITPGNVLLSRNGDVKLSDFGVARAAGRMTQTVVGEVKGKYSYMAPEVMQGDSYDQRSDVFGCGVVLWEALTTRPLFRGKSDFHVMEQVLRGSLQPPSTYNPEVPPGLDAVVLHALERDVNKRYGSARALKKALAPFMPREDPDALIEKLAALVHKFSPPAPAVATIPPTPPPKPPSIPVVPPPAPLEVPPPAPRSTSNPALAATAPPAPRPQSTPPPTVPPSVPSSGMPVGGLLPDENDGMAGALLGTTEDGAAAFDALFTSNPQSSSLRAIGGVPHAPPIVAGQPAGPSSWIEPPSPGEPGFHAMIGPDKAAHGPMSTRSAIAMLQRRDGLASDKLGISARSLLPLQEVGRLLMLDHLVKLPVPTQKPGIFGALKDSGIGRVLTTVSTPGLSGMLMLMRGSHDSMTAFIVDGYLQYTFYPDPTHHLLSLFVMHQPQGLSLLPQMLGQVLRDRISLPRVMAKVANLSGARITGAVAALSRERLLSGLLWDASQYAFYPNISAPYELSPSKEPILSLVPQFIARSMAPADIAVNAQRLVDRPLEFKDTDPRVEVEMGVGAEAAILRKALASNARLRGVWNQLAPPNTVEEQRLLLTLLALHQAAALRER